MLLMEKGGEKRYVPDIAVGDYRTLGWKGVGEADPMPVEETVPEITEPEETEAEKFVCEHCGREFGSKAALTKHTKKEHGEE